MPSTWDDAMDFSLIDYLDEGARYTKLVALLHPEGWACPHCGERHRLGIHRRHHDPVLDYQCGVRRRVFNAWTGTVLEVTHRRPSHLLMILHGITQGTPPHRWPVNSGVTAGGCWPCGTASRGSLCGGWTATP